MPRTTILQAHALLILACLAWGGSYAVGRFGLSDGSALWLTLWRWGPGAAVFMVYLIWTWSDHRNVILPAIPRLIFISALGVVIYPATLFLAVAQTTALNASLYLAATPIMIALLSALVWDDRISGLRGLGIGLGLFGACVLVFRGSFSAALNFEFATSDVWAILSALAWAGYCVSLPMKPKALGEVPFLSVLVVLGTVVLLVLAILSGESIPLPDSAQTAWSMIYFAVFPSVLAFLLWNWGTTQVGPATAAPYNNLVPFFGGGLAVLFLGEAIESYHLVGGGLVIAGLVLNSLDQ